MYQRKKIFPPIDILDLGNAVMCELTKLGELAKAKKL